MRLERSLRAPIVATCRLRPTIESELLLLLSADPHWKPSRRLVGKHGDEAGAFTCCGSLLCSALLCALPLARFFSICVAARCSRTNSNPLRVPDARLGPPRSALRRFHSRARELANTTPGGSSSSASLWPSCSCCAGADARACAASRATDEARSRAPPPHDHNGNGLGRGGGATTGRPAANKLQGRKAARLQLAAAPARIAGDWPTGFPANEATIARVRESHCGGRGGDHRGAPASHKQEEKSPRGCGACECRMLAKAAEYAHCTTRTGCGRCRWLVLLLGSSATNAAAGKNHTAAAAATTT